MKNTIEIAISTYNRANILKLWFEKNYKVAADIGFKISVYDSSTNDETKKIVELLNQSLKWNIKYVHLAPSVRLDDKIMMSVFETECDYVWPLGDSRTFDFSVIEKKIIPFTDRSYDVICLWSQLNHDNDGKTYTNPADFFNECFWHVTWLGGIIYKRTVFDFNFQDDTYKKYMSIFNRNDGFSNNGMMFNVIAQKENIRISTSEIGKIDELVKSKTPGWLKRYIEVWGDNLSYMIDNLDDIYNPYKDKVLKEVWRVLALDSGEWCYRAKMEGGLTPKIYEHYDSVGLLDRVSDNKKRIRFYAYSNKVLAKMGYVSSKVNRKLKSGIDKIVKLKEGLIL